MPTFGLTVDYVGMDVRVKFGDSALNSAELFDSLPAAPALRTFVQ